MGVTSRYTIMKSYIFFIGVINKTANIEIIHTYKPSPPPTVRDYVNPKVGDKLYDTDNRYIQEWLTGNYL